MSAKKKKKEKKKRCFVQDNGEFKDHRVNSVDSDEAAHNEPPHLDQRCLQTLTSILALFRVKT